MVSVGLRATVTCLFSNTHHTHTNTCKQNPNTVLNSMSGLIAHHVSARSVTFKPVNSLRDEAYMLRDVRQVHWAIHGNKRKFESATCRPAILSSDLRFPTLLNSIEKIIPHSLNQKIHLRSFILEWVW